MRKIQTIAMLACLCLLALPAAHADTAAITLTSFTDFTNGQWTLGFEFSPTTNINVTSLGSFFPTGANDTHGVTIWNTSGTVLATATVTGNGTQGFDYTTISPLLLTAGTDYVIGANTLNDDYADNGATWTVASGINYIQHVETTCSGVTPCFPGTAGTTSFGDFGANFTFTPAPEPGSVALLFTILAGFGVAGFRNRSRSKQ